MSLYAFVLDIMQCWLRSNIIDRGVFALYLRSCVRVCVSPSHCVKNIVDKAIAVSAPQCGSEKKDFYKKKSGVCLHSLHVKRIEVHPSSERKNDGNDLGLRKQ